MSVTVLLGITQNVLLTDIPACIGIKRSSGTTKRSSIYTWVRQMWNTASDYLPSEDPSTKH
jgi:hypothetical protein